MKKEFYIFRHGQTDFNLNNIWQGCLCDLELNATGREQAIKLREKLHPLGLEIVYSSPLKRALETAAIVTAHMIPAPKIEVVPNLREGNFGEAEGCSFDELTEKYPHIIGRILNPTKQNWDIAYPGAKSESKHQIFDRVVTVLKEISKSDKKIIGISSHGGVLSALSCGLNLKNVNFANCAVLHLEYDSETDTFTQKI